MLQGGPHLTSKCQCHNAGRQDSAWQIARISGDTPTHEHSQPWVRQRPEQADNYREQSPWHRQVQLYLGREGTPSQGEPLGSPSLSIKRLQAQLVGIDSELLVGQDTQVSEGQREFTIKNRVSGEQTGLGGAEPKGAGSPD